MVYCCEDAVAGSPSVKLGDSADDYYSGGSSAGSGDCNIVPEDDWRAILGGSES